MKKAADRETRILRARMLGQTCQDCKFRDTIRYIYPEFLYGEAHCQKRLREPKDNLCVQFKPAK